MLPRHAFRGLAVRADVQLIASLMTLIEEGVLKAPVP